MELIDACAGAGHADFARDLARPLPGTTMFSWFGFPEGARVAVVWASANRNERRWVDPDRLDITRELQRHVSVGDGIHHCLGAPPARLEARIVFESSSSGSPSTRSAVRSSASRRRRTERSSRCQSSSDGRISQPDALKVAGEAGAI